MANPLDQKDYSNAVQLSKFGSGVCQKLEGYDFFDLRKWDGESPLVSELAAGTLFYKL